MNVLKWNKWPAPFKSGACSLFLLTICSSILLWSWNAYATQDSSETLVSLPYQKLIETILPTVCTDEILSIKYTKLDSKRSYIDQTTLATLQLSNNKEKQFVIKNLGQGRNTAQTEYIIQVYCLAGLIGIGPPVVFSDLKKHILILEYIPGRQVTFLDLQKTDVLKKLAMILQRYHKAFAELPHCVAPSRLEDRVSRRLQELKLHHPMVQKILNLIKSYIPSSHIATVIHSDLKPSNILITPNGSIYIIDWSEAQHGNPSLDLASLSHHGNLSIAHEQYLLQAYFGRDLTEQEEMDFYWYKNLSLLHTAAWALRESGLKYKFIDHSYDTQRLSQLLCKFYQDEDLAAEELKDMGNYGILYFLENSNPTHPPFKKNLG